MPPLCVNIGLKALEQIAVLCTRINEFYLHVKLFIIRLFTDPFRALSCKKIKCCLEKNYRVALASPYRRLLLLYLFIYSMPSKGKGEGATHCPLPQNGKLKTCPVKTLLLPNDPWLKQIPGSQAWTTYSDLTKDFPLSSNLWSLVGGQPPIVKIVKGTE